MLYDGSQAIPVTFRLININPPRFCLLRSPLSALLLLGAALLALSGRVCAQQLYIGEEGSSTAHVGKYDVSTTIAGSINGTLTSGMAGAPTGMTVSGNTLYVTNTSNGTVSAYNATTGAAITSFGTTGTITMAGSQSPRGLLVSGNTLYVTNGNSVSTYDATNGNPIGTGVNFITSGLSTPEGMAIVGNTLYVASAGSNAVSTFNATTGSPMTASLISGLSSPVSLALDGNTLFVTNFFAGTVGAYDATTGNPIGTNGATFITVPGEAWGVVASGNNVYVSDPYSQNVGWYSATTGLAMNANYIPTSGYGPQGLALVVPEPASATLFALAAPALLGFVRRRKIGPAASR